MFGDYPLGTTALGYGGDMYVQVKGALIISSVATGAGVALGYVLPKTKKTFEIFGETAPIIKKSQAPLMEETQAPIIEEIKEPINEETQPPIIEETKEPIKEKSNNKMMMNKQLKKIMPILLIGTIAYIIIKK